DRRPAPEFPLDLLAPADAWIALAAESASVPADYIAGPLLAAFAALIGNARVVSPWEGWDEPFVLNVGLVGDPSSGKSPAMDRVLGRLRDVELSRGEGFGDEQREWLAKAEAARLRKERWQADVASAVEEGRSAPPLPVDAEEPDQPQPPRIVVNDATMEALTRILSGSPRGLLWVRDELSGLIESLGNYNKGGERAFLIQAYGA